MLFFGGGVDREREGAGEEGGRIKGGRKREMSRDPPLVRRWRKLRTGSSATRSVSRTASSRSTVLPHRWHGCCVCRVEERVAAAGKEKDDAESRCAGDGDKW